MSTENLVFIKMRPFYNRVFTLIVCLILLIRCGVQDEIQTITYGDIRSTGNLVKTSSDPILSTGLGFVIDKSSRLQASSRGSAHFDFSLLEDQEALKSYDSTTTNTTFVYYINKTDSSLTNFVISEKEGTYVAFFIEYLPKEKLALGDMSLFEGRVLLKTLDGDLRDQLVTQSEVSSNGRTSICITETRCWSVSIPGDPNDVPVVTCETHLSCTSYGGNYVAGGLDTGTEDGSSLDGYGTLTNNSMPENVPINDQGGGFEICNRHLGFDRLPENDDETSFTGEVLNIKVPAIHTDTKETVEAFWGGWCVTYGTSAFRVSTSTQASDVFKEAWKISTAEVEVWLNTQESNPGNVAFSNYFLSTFRSNLRSLSGGNIVISTGPCLGNVTSTWLAYCP